MEIFESPPGHVSTKYLLKVISCGNSSVGHTSKPSTPHAHQQEDGDLLLRFFPLGAMGSAAQILDLQNVLHWASSGVIHSSCMSLQMQSIHLPLGIFPGTTMSTIALTSFSSILCVCPYQHNPISLTFFFMLFTSSSFLMSTLYFHEIVNAPLSCYIVKWRNKR